MPAPATKASITAEAFLDGERSADSKSELWLGEIFAMSGGTFRYQLIATNLVSAIHRALAGRPCFVLGADMKVHVPSKRGFVYPDATALCGSPRFFDDTQDVLLNPSVVVEVLSPSTERFDRGEKFAGYRSIDSVIDYLIVAQDAPHIEHYRRGDDGEWILHEYVAHSSVRLLSIGIEISLDDVYRSVEHEPGS